MRYRLLQDTWEPRVTVIDVDIAAEFLQEPRLAARRGSDLPEVSCTAMNVMSSPERDEPSCGDSDPVRERMEPAAAG